MEKTDKAAKGSKPGQINIRPAKKRAQTIHQALEIAVRYHTAGDLSKAEDIYQKILQSNPNNPDALHLLGVIAHQERKNETAVDLITKALSIKPDYAEACYNLGNALRELGRLDEAIEKYHKTIAAKPDYAEAYSNLGNALKELGNSKEAVVYHRKAVDTKPNSPEVYNNFGAALKELGKLDEAATQFRKALAIKPNYAEARYNLGITSQKLGLLEEAVASYQKAIDIKPNLAEAHNTLGVAFKALGQLNEAIACYHEALAINPDFFEAGKNLLSVVLNVPGLSPGTLFTEQMRFSENYTKNISRLPEGLTNDPTPGRRLRVAYLSSDFWDHPVGRNILPLLSSHDREKFEVYCYADVQRPDAITKKFHSCVDHWHTITGKSDAEVARIMRADEIDVLVCLAGRFDRNRPLVCAHRATPVQISYHDGATSGLGEMDYWLTDTFLNPPDTKEMFTEDLYRLPVFYQYLPIEEAPPVTAVPAEQAGFITFGSFNNPAKVNGEVIRLWSEVLRSVPDSRLLFKYKNWYDQASLRDSVVERFAACGVEEDRVIFAVTLDTIKEHLGRYGEVDIALDPFPFNGATTTFQALWMGVPVVSLAGETFISRAAGSILHHLDLGGLIVDTPQAYVACARDLSGDRARLGTLRASLRERIKVSPLCDAPTYARSVETAYRDMWGEWCTQPKTSHDRTPKC